MAKGYGLAAVIGARITDANSKKWRENDGTMAQIDDSESPHNTPAYWQALGQFVQEFSEVEREANFLLWQLTDKDASVTAAIYRERMPLGEVIDALEKLYPIRVTLDGAERVLQYNMRQLKRIVKLRNDLLHNGTTFTEQGASIVRRLAARRTRIEAVPAVPLSVEVLNHLTSDCSWLATFFWLQWQFYGTPERNLAAMALAEKAWEYK